MRPAAVLLLVCSCGESQRLDPDVAVAGPGEYAGTIAFADGASVTAVTVEPPRWIPGETATLSFTASGDLGTVEIGASPPMALGRQVALGGVGAPPVEIPADAREIWQSVDVSRGENSVELALPDHWHPASAVVTLRRAASHARQGPRTSSGVAVVAMVPVERRPTKVLASRASAAVSPNGILDEPVWEDAASYDLVSSLQGEPISPHTSVRLAWDDDALYVAAVLQDRDIWTSYTQQDDPLWKEEAFEFFVFGDGSRSNYLELQVSAAGVTFDARFAAYRKGDEAWDSAWRTGVAVNGTVNTRGDRDRDWVAEIAVGWDEICEHTSVTCPVGPGTTIRVNAFRLERPRKGHPVGMALSPTAVPDFHAPENAAILELRR